MKTNRIGQLWKLAGEVEDYPQRAIASTSALSVGTKIVHKRTWLSYRHAMKYINNRIY